MTISGHEDGLRRHLIRYGTLNYSIVTHLLELET